MESGFKKLIEDICRYYRDRGLPMEALAEGIGISKRMLQKWKAEGHRPHEENIRLLTKFLKENNGGHFITRLQQILGGQTVDIPCMDRGEFPKEMDDKDVRAIRDLFPRYDEMVFLCAMVINGDISRAVAEVLPDSDLVQRAALVSRYEASMRRCKESFGLDGIYDWKDRVVQYIARIPEGPDDVEALGQKALDSIIGCYLDNKNKEVMP